MAVEHLGSTTLLHLCRSGFVQLPWYVPPSQMDSLMYSILLDLNTNCPYKAKVRLPTSPSHSTTHDLIFSVRPIPGILVSSPHKWVDFLCRIIRQFIQQVRHSSFFSPFQFEIILEAPSDAIMLYKQTHIPTILRVGSRILKRVPNYRPQSSREMAPPVYIDGNTNLTTADQRLQCLILIRRAMYPQAQRCSFYIPTLRTRPPARKGLSCPQNRVPHTGASGLAQKKSSNVRFEAVRIRLLVETMLGRIIRHTMTETHLNAVNGTLFLRPLDFFYSPEDFQLQDLCISGGSPLPCTMQYAGKRTTYSVHKLVCAELFLVSQLNR